MGGHLKHGLLALAAIAALVAAMALKGALIALPSPPEPRPFAVEADSGRAVARLQRILGDQRPHPVDSAANDAVRDRLIAEMRRVGLNPRVADHFECNGFARARAVACARVRNIVATIAPSHHANRQRPHLLLSTHYDSTFAGPGASDAGIGVASLLEVAAWLRGVRNIQRPISFLFNEGEETGLIGARAFVAHDPLAARVDSLLNFEARGVTGPAIMFETSRPNAAAIAAFREARPVANSLATDLYRLIPNSTDVAVFEERPWTILNFAIIGNETRYHSAGDDLAALDRRSLQHMGDQALGLTLGLAVDAEPPPRATGERLYMDLLGWQLIVLPMLFGMVLLGLLLLFFLVEAWRRRALGRPLAAALAGIAGSAALAWAGQAMLSLIRDGDYWRGHPWVTELAVYASVLSACLIALELIAGDAERTKLRPAFWLAFLLVGAAIGAVAPGGLIFFLLPPLVAALGMAAARRKPGTGRILAVAAILLLYLTFGPALAMFEELMSNGPHWLLAPIGAAILLPALIELRPLLARLQRRALLGGAGGLFLLGWAAVALTPAYSDDRRQLFTIEYVWDADAGTGRWAVNNDGAPVPYPADWARTEMPYSTRERWAAPAPALPLTPPAIELIGQSRFGQGRRLAFRLTANGAESIALIAPADAALRLAGVEAALRPFGRGADDDRYIVRCVGRSCDGAVLEIVAAGREPIEFTVVGTRHGLPPAAAPLVRARPALARPQYSPDSTIALRKIRL